MGKPPISDAELAVLKVLWECGSATVRQVHEQLRGEQEWAYNTVLTLLTRLRDKGYVGSSKKGVALVFRPKITQETLLRQRLGELADQICDGMASPLVHALVTGRRFSTTEIAGFRKLLKEAEQRQGGSRRKRPRGDP